MAKLVDYICLKCNIVIDDYLITNPVDNPICEVCDTEMSVYIGNVKIGTGELFRPTAARRGLKRPAKRKSANHPDNVKKRKEERNKKLLEEG